MELTKQDVIDRLRINFHVSGYISYANYHNQRAFKPIYFEIENLSKNRIDDISFNVKSSNGLFETINNPTFSIESEATVEPESLSFKFNVDYLLSLTENEFATITFEVFYKGELIYSDDKETEISTFDFWRSCSLALTSNDAVVPVHPVELKALLSAFVTPNHPLIKETAISSSRWLQEWTNDPSFDGYQSKDPNRVKQMVAAIYAAIQLKNIVYSEPPTSFGLGQRIRLVDDILDYHVGTCMDLTLFFASCLESIGLHPLLILHEGHIYCGCWLIDNCFKDGVVEDYTQITKRIVDGINEIVIFECTSVCAGKNIDFDNAVKIAARTIEQSDFEAIIDIRGLRIYYGYRPLPLRIKEGSTIKLEHTEREASEVTGQANELSIENVGEIEKEEIDKVQYWERKLLDLSSRNSLINIRLKNVIPILCHSLALLEDKLSIGQEYSLQPFYVEGISNPSPEGLADIGKNEEFVKEAGKQKELFAYSTEKTLNCILTKMYRVSKSAIEESGANTLYMTLGMLKWMDGKIVRYSPLILCPVDLTRKAGKGYCIKKRDEDIEFNITLLEMLKQNFKIEINGLDPLPQDEHGVDIKKIVLMIRKAIIDKEGWDVIEVATIGNYSFTQFVMWNDLHRYSDKLLENKIVRSLVKGMVDFDTTVPEDVDKGDVYLPISADGSQLHAIKMAEKGCTFVLHGPPGTGKSQTITALIANAIANGKTVLFVAEKMAALEVVDKRLSSLGLTPFCLQLHSNKTTKKNALEQLDAGLNLKYKGVKSDYYKYTLEDFQKARRELGEYATELHRTYPFGYSLKQLIDLYTTAEGKELRLDSKEVFEQDEKSLDIRRKLITSLITSGANVANINQNILSRYNVGEYSITLRYKIENLLNDCEDILCSIEREVMNTSDITGISCINSKEDWGLIFETIELLNKPLVSNDEISKEIDETNSIYDISISVKGKQLNLINKIKETEEKWDDSFLNANISEYEKRYEEANKKLFFKTKEINAIKDEIQSHTKYLVSSIEDVIYEIKELENNKNRLNNLMSALEPNIRCIVEQANTVDDIKNAKDAELENLKQKALEAEENFKRQQEIQEHGKNNMLDLIKSIDELKIIKDKLSRIGITDLNFFENGTNFTREDIVMLRDGLSDLQDWLVYKENRENCEVNHLNKVLEAYDAGVTDGELVNQYNKGLYKALIIGIIMDNNILNRFSGSSFNEKIRQFKELDNELIEITKEEIYYILAHQLPAKYESTSVAKELAVLKKAISSNGKGYSIRTLFAQIPQILTRICPCVLMSPISVAQYLSPDMPKFDLVVFDEASQLPTCKAIGVLARGENAVIVGDPKQMPPTSFFMSNKSDDDNIMLEDLDSILDDCLALGLPETHLEWHYRSRHESLIAFSNSEFYGNKMLTFPSVNDQEKRVKYIKVKGFYNQKTGTNEAEARSIIKEIQRRYHDPVLSKKTIGVITFNIKQQEYIDDLLLEEFKKDIEFDNWANNGEEKLFVKNLENVQGDERDVILFSVLFGPNQTGKLSLNFGPLNKEGGWKRLNVAASRAKQEMILFSIMSYDMIDLGRTNSIGVSSLRDFLEFGERGKLVKNYNQVDNEHSGMIDTIVKFLADNGYECRVNVGHSDFRIDIAVINPYDKTEYLLGIMLDGDSYARTENVRDREISQLNVLKGLGWQTYRMWTMDFWTDSNKELKKLFDYLEELKQNASLKKKEKINEEIEAVNIDFDLIDENEEKTIRKKREIKQKVSKQRLVSESSGSVLITSKVVNNNDKKKYNSDEYKYAELTPMVIAESDIENNVDEIRKRITKIIEIEAPILKDKLFEKVAKSLLLTVQSQKVLNAFNEALDKCYYLAKKQSGKVWIWAKNQDPDEYFVYRIENKRNLDLICIQELMNAVCLAIQEKGTLDEEILIKVTGIYLGYMQVSDDVESVILTAIRQARKEGRIFLNKEGSYDLGE